MDNSVDAIVDVIREVCSQEMESDGLVFDMKSVTGEAIAEDADYLGVRVMFFVTLQSARVKMQIDMGFGDVITPVPTMIKYPVLLDFAAPELMGCPRETVVAEKFEAMTKLGLLNSRMKDFYDLWILSKQFDFKGSTLATAIRKTFAKRKTAILSRPIALTPKFGSDVSKQTQWQAFLRKTKLDGVPSTLQVVINDLTTFLEPVAASIEGNLGFDQRWFASGPWQSS